MLIKSAVLIITIVIACALAAKPLMKDHDAYEIMMHPSWEHLPADTCGGGNQGRIIGGHTPELGAYPWLVRLGYIYHPYEAGKEPEFRCGGALLSERYVLTAAHCITEMTEPELTMVRLGEFDHLSDPDCDEHGVCAPPVQDIDIEDFFSYFAYGPPNNKHDIALLRLQRRAILGEYVQAICLPYGELLSKNHTGDTALVAGWGIEDISHPSMARVLQVVDVPIQPFNICFAELEPLEEQTQICAGGNVGKDSCSGDSGGPLMKIETVNNEPPRYFLIGVVSYGPTDCGTTTTPAVYTNTASYLPWILDRIRP